MSDRSPSSASIAVPARRRTDPENTWRPEDDDDSLEATAKRARMALANDVAHTVAIADLTAAIRPLTSSISTLTRLLKWAGGIAGAAVLLAFVAAGIGIVGRVRIDPPALQAPAVAR